MLNGSLYRIPLYTLSVITLLNVPDCTQVCEDTSAGSLPDLHHVPRGQGPLDQRGQLALDRGAGGPAQQLHPEL